MIIIFFIILVWELDVRVSISVLTNAICNHIIRIRTTYHKGCLITFHVLSHKTQPAKAQRKLIYILSIEDYT